MAADEENDEMASLFEGMVLFDPSEMVAEESNINVGLDQQPSTAATVDVGADRPSALPMQVPLAAESSPSQPLDENLFSDLTLVTPSQSLELEDIKSNSDPSSISLISRQNSTRKKKRASLRIGYGRDRDRYHASDSFIATSSPNDHSHINTRFPEADEKKKEQGEGEEEDDDAEEDQEPYSSSMISAAQDRDSSSDTASHGILSNDTPEQTANPASSGVVEDAKTGQLIISKSHDPVEFRFEQLRILISNKLKDAHETVAFISSERKESIRMRRKAARSVTQAYAEYKELEKKLEEACEAEDFEKAERVSESLASTEKEKECLVVALRDAEAHCDAVDSKMRGVLESLIQVEEECASMLQTFAMVSSF